MGLQVDAARCTVFWPSPRACIRSAGGRRATMRLDVFVCSSVPDIRGARAF